MIFISYRRGDSAGYAGRLCEHVSAIFGADQVFMDVQDISPGQDFAAAIETTISACPAMIVVIGPRWVDDLKARGGEDDFVHQEVSVALRRHVTVIPALVGGAAMPSAAELPAHLVALSRRQAVAIRDTSFETDSELLIAALRKIPSLSQTKVRARRKLLVWACLAAALLLSSAGLLFRGERPKPEISGSWIAEMNKPNQRTYRVRLDLVSSGRKVTGSVSYPTGDGSVQGGTLEKDRLTFFTVHIPQFASEAATIRWSGVIEDEGIRFTAADEGGVASGVAHRRP
ncbi:MAG: toll/interleukin-1 receptor domain-containing protein [Candidatus Solibacter sp.]